MQHNRNDDNYFGVLYVLPHFEMFVFTLVYYIAEKQTYALSVKIIVCVTHF